MTKRKVKELEDANSAAFNVLRHVIETSETLPSKSDTTGKNPAAVALGRLGASKGGKARAKALTKVQRKAIAKKAALGRWGKSG